MTDRQVMDRLGVFVGGASSRMGTPKGLLTLDGETLIERAVRIGREAGMTPVLVGDALPYAELCPDVKRVGDDPVGIGPLGGLRALLMGGDAIVWACDMPYVGVEHLRQLQAAPLTHAALSVRECRYEPLLAKYSRSLLPLLTEYLRGGGRSFQRLLSGLASESISIVPLANEVLRDWDQPSDVPR